jgi:hypothetical protein
MKLCPQCRQNFSDETHFCLSDGTPLIPVDDALEELTLVRPLIPNIQTPSQPVRSGKSRIFVYLAGGLFLLLLVAGVIGVAIFALTRSRNSDTSNNTSSNSILTNKDQATNQINKEKANLQSQQDQLEKEKQRLSDERKKLNEEKNKTGDTPLPPTSFPAQPTARIKFGRGHVAETFSGKIYTQRSFVLEARSGQYLSASVVGAGCVTFSNGGTNLGFVTVSGDNRVTLVNNCNSEASFTLTVAIK